MAQLFQSEALGAEWILDAQLCDLLAVLHILAVQPLAACFKRGGDDDQAAIASISGKEARPALPSRS